MNRCPGGQLHIGCGLPHIEAVSNGSNEGDSERSPSQVPSIRAAFGKLPQAGPVTDGDEVSQLRILRALRPPASIQDRADRFFGQEFIRKHEAKILASMVAEPQLVSAELMEEWISDFDSWDVCDQVCGNLFDKTPYAYQKAAQWCQQEKEFVRRAGFVMMAELAVHDKQAHDEAFL